MRAAARAVASVAAQMVVAARDAEEAAKNVVIADFTACRHRLAAERRVAIPWERT